MTSVEPASRHNGDFSGPESPIISGRPTEGVLRDAMGYGDEELGTDIAESAHEQEGEILMNTTDNSETSCSQ